MTTLGAFRFDELLAATAAKTPTPGGGAIAGATGALACALAGMVLSYSVNRKDLAPHKDRLEAAARDIEQARADFLHLADADAAAYALLNELQKLPPTDPRRAAELPAAVEGAVAVPVRCIRLGVDLVRRCLELAPVTNRHLRSDLAIAGLLAHSAAEAGMWNVRANLPLMDDTARRGLLQRECEGLLARAQELNQKLAGACL